MLSRLFLAIVALLAVPAHAGTCTITDHAAAGLITAARLNARYAQIETCVNGELGNANFASDEPLAVSKLQNPNAIFATSFTLADEDGDATAGEDIGATTNIRKWRVPVSSTVIGMSVSLRCPSDASGTPADCDAASVTLILQKDTTTIKTFTAVTGTTTQTDFAISSAVTNAQDLNLDISGTLTAVDFVDVVVYYKAQHQG